MSSVEFRKDLFADERSDDLNEVGKPTIRQDIAAMSGVQQNSMTIICSMVYCTCVVCDRHIIMQEFVAYP